MGHRTDSFMIGCDHKRVAQGEWHEEIFLLDKEEHKAG